MHLDLHADIAVLSACETARGRVSAGEGIIGFTWAFFAAGCPSSVVSEWKVDSATTKTLMIEFHRRLLAAKEAPFAKADALRGGGIRSTGRRSCSLGRQKIILTGGNNPPTSPLL